MVTPAGWNEDLSLPQGAVDPRKQQFHAFFQPIIDTLFKAGFADKATQNFGKTALLIECADAEIAASLATDRRTAKLCLRAGERNLVVPAASERAFRNAIHALGYGMPRS